jgi:hypothetical protein
VCDVAATSWLIDVLAMYKSMVWQEDFSESEKYGAEKDDAVVAAVRRGARCEMSFIALPGTKPTRESQAVMTEHENGQQPGLSFALVESAASECGCEILAVGDWNRPRTWSSVLPVKLRMFLSVECGNIPVLFEIDARVDGLSDGGRLRALAE